MHAIMLPGQNVAMIHACMAQVDARTRVPVTIMPVQVVIMVPASMELPDVWIQPPATTTLPLYAAISIYVCSPDVLILLHVTSIHWLVVTMDPAFMVVA
jgi:hypothetical protein